MIAHIGEIPSGPRVARHSGPVLVGFTDVGEGETFGGKADVGAPRVVERPHIGADSVIVRDAAVSLKRKGATRR